MSGENRTPTRQFIQLGDAHSSVESAGDGEKNLCSQLLDRRMTSSEIDSRKIALSLHD